MAKSLTEIGQEEFEKNETNFFKRIKQIITKDESPFDETTEIKVFFNFHEDCRPYFKFNISTFRMELSTDYYRYDYIYQKGPINNRDEIISGEEDVEIFLFSGNDLIN